MKENDSRFLCLFTGLFAVSAYGTETGKWWETAVM
jgi:hypothetical protein